MHQSLLVLVSIVLDHRPGGGHVDPEGEGGGVAHHLVKDLGAVGLLVGLMRRE